MGLFTFLQKRPSFDVRVVQMTTDNLILSKQNPLWNKIL